MPSLIRYDRILQTVEPMGMRCVYHNSGAFAFAGPEPAHSFGWIGPDDPSIRTEARPLVRRVPAPYEPNLARLLVRAWCEAAPAPQAWVLPTSHWAYELQFGSREWMPALLERMGVDADELAGRNQADGIAFELEDRWQLEEFAQHLLELLHGSDFSVLFPPLPVLARLHHHKQIWWTSTDSGLVEAIARRLPHAE